MGELAMRQNYEAAFEKVIGHEGGFTRDKKDRGNWTTGIIGQGKNNGTKFGVSCMAYPNEDIENMKLERAHEIYKRDYWDKMRCDDLPGGVDYACFDQAINSGVSRSIKWLQKAVDVTVDGKIGPATVGAAQAAPEIRTIDRMCDKRLAFMKELKTWPRYGKGWSNRVAEVRSTAKRMVGVEKV
jgi:lysozyme family protein